MSVDDLKKFGIEGPKKGKFVVLLSYKWCGSCKATSKLLKEFRDKGFINLKEIDISENCKLAQELNIFSIPALIFFNNAKLFDKSLEINGEIIVNKGIMIGSFNDAILKDIIKKI